MQTHLTPRPLADRIALLSPDGRHISWLSEPEARDYIRRGLVELLGTKNRIRMVRQLRQPIGTPEQRLGAHHRPGPARRHYSHNHETRENPKGVWTHVHIPKSHRRFFRPDLPKGGPAA